MDFWIKGVTRIKFWSKNLYCPHFSFVLLKARSMKIAGKILLKSMQPEIFE